MATAPNPPRTRRRLPKLIFVLLLGLALPVVFVVLLFAIGGADDTLASATSPDGAREARVTVKGGSLQYPPTILAIRATGGGFGQAGEDCRIADWSAADEPGGQEGRPSAYAITIHWRDDATLEVGDPQARLALPPAACGVAIVTTKGSGA